MNLINPTSKLTPFKIILYWWIYPAIGVVITLVLYYLSGCEGGYFDTKLECEVSLYQNLFFLQLYQLLATAYLFFSFIPILIIALIRAFRVNPSL